MDNLTLTQNELVAISIAMEDYLREHAESFEYPVHPESNIGVSLSVYNKIYALGHGLSAETCDTARIPCWLKPKEVA